MTEKLIYMDYMATTPVAPHIADNMRNYLCIDGIFGNPISAHCFGQPAKKALEHAAEQVATSIHADATEILWTSCATESNSLAIRGVAAFHQHRGKHIITSLTEHKSVLKTCQALEKEGFDVTYLKPGHNGIIQPEQVTRAFREDTFLVSIMCVNNEVGIIQDITAIGQATRERGILFHVDAVQAIGKVPIDVKKMCVDLMSFSGHKIYAPKGIGVLYYSQKPRVRLTPQLLGGGQQQGMRAGTLPTHQIVAIGQAFEFVTCIMAEENQRIQGLSTNFLEQVMPLGGVHLNGDPLQRVPHNLSLCFDGVAGESLMLALSHVAVSAGSACNSLSPEASHVLKAMDCSIEHAQSTVRFSLGHYTTQEEINHVCHVLKETVTKLRAMSPNNGGI
jgi:cysteine desulfurase